MRQNLHKRLVSFSEDSRDDFTYRDAFNGVQIFGSIGSGKSSGSGKTLAKSYLKNGFGGLVLCAKPDEARTWREYGRETGRLDDMIFFNKESSYEFNPLEYEMTRSGEGAGEIFNLTNLFMEIYKMGNRFSGGDSGGSNARYWDNALKRCINRTIQLLKLAGRPISIDNMRKVISSIPYADDYEIQNLRSLTDEENEAWGERSFCIDCIMAVGERLSELEDELGNDEGDQEEYEVKQATYELVYNYFMEQFPSLTGETRPIIVESFLGLAEPFLSGILKRHFAGGITLSPEVTQEGKIIILEFPVKEFLQAGVYAQGIFKLLWQQAIERRKIEESPKPVFLWVDEAQLFLSDYDQIFQTTARSSHAATVFISQNISNYYVALGGQNPKAKADALLANLGTKIFHANNDSVTNNWGAETIGKIFKKMRSLNVGRTSSAGISEQLNYQVDPVEFTTLANGSEYNDYHVEGVVTITGKEWSNGQNFNKVVFDQRL
jgi:hypothetical protein